jgi:hypothetical protein
VTQYDVIEYDGDCECHSDFFKSSLVLMLNADTTDLEFCGSASEERHITEEDATLHYKTECRICPALGCDVVAYLPEKTDVTLTCWTIEGQVIIDDP